MRKARHTAVFLIFALFMMTAFLSCADDGITVSLGGKKIYSDTPYPSMWQQSAHGKKTLTLENYSESDATFIIYTESSDSPRTVLSCTAGEKASQTLTFEKTPCAVNGIAIENGSMTTAYVLNADGFSAAADEADIIYAAADIETDGDLILHRPVEVKTGKYSVNIKGNLIIDCEDEGEFILDKVEAEGFFADAPKCSVIASEKTASYAEGWNTVLKSLNGKDMPGHRRVTSNSQLEKLCDPSSPLPVKAGSTVELSGFKIITEASFTVPVTLKLSDVVCDGSISFKCSDSAGEICIDGKVPASSVHIDAPGCSVVWNDCEYSVFEAADMYKFRSFNGVDASYAVLGGAEEKMLDISMESTENMTDDIQWIHSAPYTYVALLTSPAAPSALHSAHINISADGEPADIVWDSFCLSDDGGADLLSPIGTSFVSDGARYRLITESACRIPVVVIDSGGIPIESKEEYIDASISVESEFSTDKLPSLEKGEVNISGRGNSTWYWSNKKPYKLKFDKKTSVLGMHAAKDWVLLANFADKSLIRNYVALESAKVLDSLDCYATQYPVDVFLNGEYVGVYTMGEKVETGEGRAYVREDGTSVDCGFLLELNGGDSDRDDEADIFRNVSIGPIKIVYPGSRLTVKQAEYIKNYMGLADNAIRKMRNAEEYIDLESLADFILINELTYNSDGCFRRSLFFAKDAGERLRISQVWDFDLAFGNSYADGSYEEWACLANNGYVNTSWTSSLMENSEFKEILKSRWNKNKEALLSTAMNAVDHASELVYPSADANFNKWDIMYLKVAMQPDACYEYHTYEGQVEYLRTFINNRWQWIDSKLNEYELPTE